MEEKNDSLVQEGEVVAWAGEVLVSEEDKDGGSAGDGFGDRMEGESEFWTECPSKELSLLGQGLSQGKLFGPGSSCVGAPSWWIPGGKEKLPA